MQPLYETVWLKIGGKDAKNYNVSIKNQPDQSNELV